MSLFLLLNQNILHTPISSSIRLRAHMLQFSISLTFTQHVCVLHLSFKFLCEFVASSIRGPLERLPSRPGDLQHGRSLSHTCVYDVIRL